MATISTPFTDSATNSAVAQGRTGWPAGQVLRCMAARHTEVQPVDTVQADSGGLQG